VTDYWRWLDIGRAVAGVEFKAGGATYKRESFASHPDGWFVTRISCTKPGAVGFTLRLSRWRARRRLPWQRHAGDDGDDRLPERQARDGR